MFDFFMIEYFVASFIIAVVTPVLGYIAYRLGYGSYQANYACKLHASTTCPPADDSISSTREVVCFLEYLIEQKKIDIRSLGLKRLLHNVKTDMAYLSRACHGMGVEILIKVVSKEDLESGDKDVNKDFKETCKRKPVVSEKKKNSKIQTAIVVGENFYYHP